MNGKIAHLPQALREELNRRLDEGHRHDRILAWLNSIPKVQALIRTDFAGRPISKQNLHEWSKHGFRQWKVRQQALAFAIEPVAGSSSPKACSTSQLTDKLVQWLAFRFAASAQTFAPADDQSGTDLRQLRHLAADIVALRRAELHSRRIAIEEKQLALETAELDELREDEFWEWTKDPDIRDKLRRQFERERAWHDTLRAAVPEIAPYLPKSAATQPAPDETASPAALI